VFTKRKFSSQTTILLIGGLFSILLAAIFLFFIHTRPLLLITIPLPQAAAYILMKKGLEGKISYLKAAFVLIFLFFVIITITTIIN
jgi:hypothetical protein